MQKKGLSVHSSLIKYKLNSGEVIKRLCYTMPEGDETQDIKSALVHIDAICEAIVLDPLFSNASKLIPKTYSSPIFYIGVFDLLASHGLKLDIFTHN